MSSKTWFEPIEVLVAGIVARDGCSVEEATAIARELADLDPSLQSAFKTWWETGDVSADCTVHGYTPRRFIDDGWCKTIAVAFTWMNGLKKRPEEAKRVLRRGRDYIRPSPNEWVREEAAGDGSEHGKG